MNAGLISRRYATVLYDYAEKNAELAQVYDDALTAYAVLSEEKGVQDVMSSPLQTTADKKAFLTAVFDKHSAQSLMKFMMFVVDKGRAELLGEILRVFATIYRKKQGIKSADVTTATELTSKKQSEFSKMLEDKMQCKVEVTYRTNASIIGGIIVSVDGKQLDCSVSHQLNEIERGLMN